MTKTDLSRICMAAAALLAAGTVTASEPAPRRMAECTQVMMEADNTRVARPAAKKYAKTNRPAKATVSLRRRPSRPRSPV